MKPALFLDLDGTIRYSTNGEFINNYQDVAIFDDVAEKLKEYDDHLLFGVTNQGGVAFDHKTIEDVHAEIDVTNLLLKEQGVELDHVVYSPFHPDSDHPIFGVRSFSRKPNIGMLVLACNWAMQEKHIIVDLNNSLMVGDRPEDQECAGRAEVDFQWAKDFFGRQ